MKIGSAVYDAALKQLGTKEYFGSEHNPKIVEMFSASGHSWVQDDETPWCSAFVNATMAAVGVQGTMKLNARSWLDWGRSTDLSNVKKGDVVVFWRGTVDSWKGHVGFYDSHDDNYIYVLGGNQGNEVSIKSYARSRLLGIRTYVEPRSHKAQSKTLQASVTSGVAAATGGITALGQLEGNVQMVVLACVTIVALCSLVIFKERLLKWSRGDR